MAESDAADLLRGIAIDIDPEALVLDAIIIIRSASPSGEGDSSLTITSSPSTDWITRVGMLKLATHIAVTGTMEVDDDE